MPDEPLPTDSSALSHLAFHGHPFGIVLSDRHGTVSLANVVARTLVGPEPILAEGKERAVCELIGCRRPGGPLEHACLHELAAGRGPAPLPEVRIDLPTGAATPAVWVTVAEVRGRPGLILTELRPGLAEDRRRRTTPHWTSAPRLRVVTLGRTRLIGNEGPIEGRWLANRSGRILKFLLAQRKRTVFTDEIAEKLWLQSTPASVKSLRYFVHTLRTDLEPEREGRGASSFIVAQPGGYALNLANMDIDADEFEAHVSAGLEAQRAGADDVALERLAAGMELYGGEFLADEPYGEWALDERDRLHTLATDALRAIIELRRAAGDPNGAVAALERLTALEPFDLTAHAELFALLVDDGRRSDAVRRHQALRHRMLATFGEDIEPLPPHRRAAP